MMTPPIARFITLVRFKGFWALDLTTHTLLEALHDKVVRSHATTASPIVLAVARGVVKPMVTRSRIVAKVAVIAAAVIVGPTVVLLVM